MTHVVHVIPNDGVGGVELAAKTVVGVKHQEFDVRLLFVADASTSGPVRAGEPASQLSAANLFAYIKAFGTIRKLRPDVLICSLWKTVPIALLVRLFLPKTRLALLVHAERSAHGLDALFSAVGGKLVDEIWGDSLASVQSRFPKSRKPERVISFVTQHLRPSKSAPSRASPKFVVWARLTSQKGLDRAIQLIAALVAIGVDARFDIWGCDGGSLQSLQLLTRSLRLTEQVSFRGEVKHSELSHAVSDATFFLQPSRYEGMSMACVEAMQLGLVPVVTAVGEMGRYVVDGITGLIVDPADITGTARRIADLLAQPQSYELMRRNAIQKWQNAPLYRDDIVSAARALLTALERPAPKSTVE